MEKLEIFNKTLQGIQMYWPEWNVKTQSGYEGSITVTIRDQNKAPFIQMIVPTNYRESAPTAYMKLMHYRSDEEMAAYGSLAASLFAQKEIQVLVVEFEEEFSSANRPEYAFSEKYVLPGKNKALRAPFHFTKFFEDGLLKHVGALHAFSPKLDKPLSDGDSFFAVYARTENVAERLSGAFESVFMSKQMKDVQNRLCETMGGQITKRAEFSHVHGRPHFVWESTSNVIELDLTRIESRFDRKGRFQ